MLVWSAATVDLYKHRTLIFRLLSEIHTRLTSSESIKKRPQDLNAHEAEWELSTDSWTEQDLANIAWVAGKAVRAAPLECKRPDSNTKEDLSIAKEDTSLGTTDSNLIN